MAYNYSQPQYQQIQTPSGYTNYRQPAPQYPTWTQNPIANQPIQQIRPVTSIEEVRACPIDFDGSIFYFTDVANRRIYTKQIGLDGSAIINLYEQKEITPAAAVTPIGEYVTKEEFETTIKALIEKYETVLTNTQQSSTDRTTVETPKKVTFKI